MARAETADIAFVADNPGLLVPAGAGRARRRPAHRRVPLRASDRLGGLTLGDDGRERAGRERERRQREGDEREGRANHGDIMATTGRAGAPDRARDRNASQ